jgi:hypothetical protein
MGHLLHVQQQQHTYMSNLQQTHAVLPHPWCWLPLQAEPDAHNTPIQCMEHCLARQEVATCGMGSKVKVWSLAKPTQPRLTQVLDHSDPATRPNSASPGKQQGPADVNPHGKSNMQWLTRSDIDGLAAGVGSAGKGPGQQQGGSGLPSIVAEAISHASEDVPEVTQVSSWL